MADDKNLNWRVHWDATAAIDVMANVTNGHVGLDEVATAIMNEHPTRVGQIAKAVAIGIMRRATNNPAWKPFDNYGAAKLCDIEQALRPVAFGDGDSISLPAHPRHDGRWDCTTVVAAELMARQSFI